MGVIFLCIIDFVKKNLIDKSKTLNNSTLALIFLPQFSSFNPKKHKH